MAFNSLTCSQFNNLQSHDKHPINVKQNVTLKNVISKQNDIVKNKGHKTEPVVIANAEVIF